MKPISGDVLLKYWLDLGKPYNSYDCFTYQLNGKLVKLSSFGLSIGFLGNLSWSSEYGYRGCLLDRTKSLLKLRGSLPVYARRREMLGRKINFRRKVKKKKFEEY